MTDIRSLVPEWVRTLTPYSPGMPIEDFAAILNAEPRALWRLQTMQAAKDAVKACLGRRGWAALRMALLRLRYARET